MRLLEEVISFTFLILLIAQRGLPFELHVPNEKTGKAIEDFVLSEQEVMRICSVSVKSNKRSADTNFLKPFN